MSGGRPSIYSIELVERICERLAYGESLVAICESPGMPAYSSVTKWRREIPEFSAMYARAREDQADYDADQTIALADEQPPMVQTQFGEHCDPAFVQWKKNQMQARQWRASKMNKRVYGNVTTLAGDPDNPLAIADVTDAKAALAAKLGAIAASGSTGGVG